MDAHGGLFLPRQIDFRPRDKRGLPRGYKSRARGWSNDVPTFPYFASAYHRYGFHRSRLFSITRHVNALDSRSRSTMRSDPIRNPGRNEKPIRHGQSAEVPCDELTNGEGDRRATKGCAEHPGARNRRKAGGGKSQRASPFLSPAFLRACEKHESLLRGDAIAQTNISSANLERPSGPRL